MSKFNPANPVYTVSDIEQMFDMSSRAVLDWLKKDYVPGAFRTPGGHWRIPEAGLMHVMRTMDFRDEEIEHAIKEFKNAQ